jgi:hypothetical protein
MNLLEIISACQARVTGGTEYQWQCYGSNARYMDFADQDGTECISAIFDAINQTVYELHLHVPGYDQAFVWRNPDFESSYVAECIHRKMEPNVAYDSVKYIPVDAETALQYTKDIVGTYYDNLPVPETT